MKVETFGKTQWVELFREIGLDEAQMHHWHGSFESRFPRAHQRFLEWLGIEAAEIEQIRESSRQERTG